MSSMMSEKAVDQYVIRCGRLEEELRIKTEALVVAEALLAESADLIRRYEEATRPVSYGSLLAS